MAREALTASCYIKKLSAADKIRVNVIYCKYAFCKRSGLIENNSIYLGQDFHIACAFDENTVFGSSADTAKERERNRYDERAGAGYYKEYTGSC